MRATTLSTPTILAALVLGWQPAATRALTIQTNFIPAGSEILGIGMAESAAANVAGGGSLQATVRAAADAWEALIDDDFTLSLDYGWFPTLPISGTAFHQGVAVGGSPLREMRGSLAFNSDNAGGAKFFLDPTPTDREEFSFSQEAFNDFGGGPIETRREYVGATADIVGAHDIYSTALHEIGHALGLVGWSFFNDETSDGDIDIEISPFSGSALPMSGTHISYVGPLMSSTGRPLGTRRDVTQADLLAICQVSQFSQCNIPLLSSAGDFDGNDAVDGADFSEWQRGNSPVPRSIADLAAWQKDYGHVSGLIAAVPEPDTLVTAVVAALSALLVVALPRSARRVSVGAAPTAASPSGDSPRVASRRGC